MKKSWFAKRCRVWRRWWRHPERDLARRQFRRGVRLWLRWPWNAALVFIILFQCAFAIAPLFGSLVAIYAVGGMLGILVPLLNMVAWANCLQDDGMNYFRGSRLGELLITPSGPRRFFPALLMSPIGAWGLTHAIGTMIALAGIIASLFIPHTNLPGYDPFPAMDNHLVLRCAFQVVQAFMGFAMSMAIMAGATARVAAWSIGNERSVAMAKSIVGLIGCFVLVSFMVSAFSMLGVMMVGMEWVIPFSYFLMLAAIGLGILFWRTGLKNLRSEKTIAKLQQAMETVK